MCDEVRPPDHRTRPCRIVPLLNKLSRYPKLLLASIVTLPTIFWRVFWIAYFLLTAVLLVVRFAVLPQVANERARIETMLSQAMGQTVEIGAIGAEWNGPRPTLALQAVRVLDAAKRPALELPRVDAVLAWSSLLHLRPILHRLEVREPDLAIRREQDGSLYVAGIKIGGGTGEGGFGKFVLDQDQILIRDARVSWSDMQRGAPTLVFDKLNLRLDNDGDRHRFAVLASPPSQWSQAIDLRGDLRGRRLEDWASWRGTLYLAVEDADLAAWKRWLDYPVALDRGRINLRAWLNIDGPNVFALTSDVALADLSAKLGDDLARFGIHSLSGRVRSTYRDGDISVAGERLTMLTAEGGRVEPTSFSLRSRPARGQEPARGELSTGRLDLGLLATLAERLPLPDLVRAPLQSLRPRGRLDALQLSWESKPDQPFKFTLDTQFAQLGLEPDGQLPGVENLSGRVVGNERTGKFQLSVENGRLSLPEVMPEPIRLDQATIDGGWGHERERPEAPEALTIRLASLKLANPDARGEFSGFWRSAATGPGYLDLRGSAQQVLAASAVHYMPLITPPEVTDWIGQGLRAGRVDNVSLQVTGKLDDFPYRKGGGVFRISGQLADAEIMFAPGWLGLSGLRGRLLFDGARMLITAQAGRYLGAQTPDVRVEIPDLLDLGQQVLLVDGKARGATSDFLHYVYSSNLAAVAGDFTRGVSARGVGELALHIEVPLNHADKTTVKGEYRFAGNQLKLLPQLPELADASGSVSFTEAGIGLRGGEADFLGNRIRASGVTEEDGSLRFDLSGKLSVASLRSFAQTPLWGYLRGEADAGGTVRVQGRRVEVSLNSTLAGVASTLPPPLQKAEATAWPLSVVWRSQPGGEGWSTDRWQLDVDQRLNLAWEEVCAPRCAFARGALAYGAQADLPAQGWRLAGRFDKLNVDPWRPVVSALIAGEGGFSASGRETLAGLAFKASELTMGEHRFRDVSAKALRQNGNWRLQIEGPQAEGELMWIEAGRGTLQARLKHLTLDPVPSVSAGAAEDAQAGSDDTTEELPALDVIAEQFYLRKLDLGRLQLAAVNAGKIWQLKKISLKSSDFDFEGRGLWQATQPAVGPGRKTSTHLDFELASQNTGAMLDRLGYPNTVREGKADLVGSLSWQGPPTSIHYPSLSGSMQLNAASGRFNKLEPGAGRLLGLLSLQFLPRRLTLDFRDLFSEGFAFDSIKGSMDVTSGVMRTSDLKITGAAAQVSMQGTTDLGREVHDLHLTVQPTLTETVAVGVVVGQAAVGVLNPLAGVAAYLAQKLLRDPVEKIFSYDYEITGPWSDPKIDRAGSNPSPPADKQSGARPRTIRK